MKKGKMKKMDSDWKMMGIELFGKGRAELLKELVIQLGRDSKKLMWIATVNPEFVMKTLEDKGFLEILQKRTLNVADGVGLVWAKTLNEKFQITNSKLQTNPNDQINKVKTFGVRLWLGFWVGVEVLGGKYRDWVVAGSSLMEDLGRVAAQGKMKVFFLGGWGDRAERTAQKLGSQISDLRSGFCCGRPE